MDGWMAGEEGRIESKKMRKTDSDFVVLQLFIYTHTHRGLIKPLGVKTNDFGKHRVMNRSNYSLKNDLTHKEHSAHLCILNHARERPTFAFGHAEGSLFCLKLKSYFNIMFWGICTSSITDKNTVRCNQRKYRNTAIRQKTICNCCP